MKVNNQGEFMFNGNQNEVTNGITTGVEARKQRGLEIAAVARIEKDGKFYLVPSQTNPRATKYKVWRNPAKPVYTCNCPDHETRRCNCKHIYAVQYFLRREDHADGSTTVTEQITVTKTRKTYAQDWPAYNAAQVNESRHFPELLADLCKMIEQPAQDMSKGGRPRLPLADAVYAAVLKVYSTMSARRFVSDLCEAQEKGFIQKVPHFNSVLKALENAELFPILVAMIERSGAALASVESQFAVDSTGFAYSRFTRWYDIKYNKFTSEQQWVKAHICCGTKTNIVTAVEIKDRDTADATQLPALVETTAKRFQMAEVSADKGYSGQESHNAISRAGAKPFIMFKENATGGIGGLFRKMFHYFQFKREEFLTHYHRRSNVESTVMMIKTKFGDAVRSKTEVAAKNEVLAKIVCHNICCLISAIYELGIEPVFAPAGCTQTPMDAHLPTLF
jgi:transposase